MTDVPVTTFPFAIPEHLSDLWAALFPGPIGDAQLRLMLAQYPASTVWQFMIAEVARSVCRPTHLGTLTHGRCSHCGEQISVAKEFAQLAAETFQDEGATELRVTINRADLP